MLSTFTTEHGTLIIPTANIRRIEDVERRHGPDKPNTIECVVQYVINNTEVYSQYVTGTARENLERLIREDQERSAAYERLQQQQQQGLPALPFPRGRTR